jgi:tellurite resistance protein
MATNTLNAIQTDEVHAQLRRTMRVLEILRKRTKLSEYQDAYLAEALENLCYAERIVTGIVSRSSAD